MSHNKPILSFVELEAFARAREAYGMEDDEFGELQRYMSLNPEVGDVIPASSGCRKLRWRMEGTGKRGGYRVIYFLRLDHGRIVLVLLYGKNRQANVDPALLKTLRKEYERGEDES
jgi:hypothetical protein